MMKLLIVCSLFSIVVDKLNHKPGDPPFYIEGLAIMMAVVVVTSVNVISDYRKEGEFLRTLIMEEGKLKL